MIAVIVLSAILANACWAAPRSAAAVSIKSQPYLLRNEHIYDNDGQFALAYQLNDGTSQTRQGTLVINDEGTGYVMNQRGTYSFISPEGVNVKMSYTADKDGFKVTGYPLPKPVKA